MNDLHHNWLIPGRTLEPVLVLEDWLGPVSALVKDEDSDQYALIYLVAWEAPTLKNRIFALRRVPGKVAETYLRNVSRDYCDLTRKQQESDALFSAADPVSHLVATNNGLTVQSATPTDLSPPILAWRDIDADNYVSWADAMSFSHSD